LSSCHRILVFVLYFFSYIFVNLLTTLFIYLMKKFLFLLTIFSLSIFVYGQEMEGPTLIGKSDKMEVMPALAGRTNLEPAMTKEAVMKDGRARKYNIVIGKDRQMDGDPLLKDEHPLSKKLQGRTPDLVFETAASNSQPTDPDIAVGPNHLIAVFNTGFRIFNKSGVALTGQTGPTAIFGAGNYCCDLTVSYDRMADRWVMSILGGGAKVAVSNGPDPLTASWFVYTFTAVSDYQKLSVWSDGYYMTENTGSAQKIWAFDRAKMLVGNTSAVFQRFNLPGMVTSGFHSPQFLSVAGTTFPPAGNVPVVYMQDNAWGGVANDHIKMWTLNVNWTTPTSSTISTAAQLPTAPFVGVFDGGGFANLAQPNGGALIDALQATIMNQAQYRRFPTYNSALFNFVVNVATPPAKRAGIRWYELRQTADGQPWTIHQEGTFTSPNNKNAWAGSLIMDKQGNIGMGYTGMGGTTNTLVSSYYTGRLANDPLNTMTINETLIAAGNANIPGTRYLDYGKIDIDPTDNLTFWFVNELMVNGRKNIAGRFKIGNDFNNDIGVISVNTPNTGTLTANETVQVTLFNYGLQPQSNFPVLLTVNGNPVATETFTGTIASQTSATYTFTATANLGTPGQVYNICAATQLVGDQDAANNQSCKSVTHVFGSDVGVTAITSPNSGAFMTTATITISVQNFGTSSQSNIPVQYTINGGAPVTAVMPGPLAGGATANYSFATLGNFSTLGTYTIVAQTNLSGDAVPANNGFTKVITNSACNQVLKTENPPLAIGPNLGTVTNSTLTYTNTANIASARVRVNLTHTWNEDMEIRLISPSGTTIMLADNRGGNTDNYTNTWFDDAATTPIASGTGPFTGSYIPDSPLSVLNGTPTNGTWTLRVTDTVNQDGGQILDWTLELCEVPLSTPTFDPTNFDFIIANASDKTFQFKVGPEYDNGTLILEVYNVTGQTLLRRKSDDINSYILDMNYADTGVYFVRVFNDKFNSVKKIMVK
jgi:subtilisin-like proprotein convertase family protein